MSKQGVCVCGGGLPEAEEEATQEAQEHHLRIVPVVTPRCKCWQQQWRPGHRRQQLWRRLWPPVQQRRHPPPDEGNLALAPVATEAFGLTGTRMGTTMTNEHRHETWGGGVGEAELGVDVSDMGRDMCGGRRPKV